MTEIAKPNDGGPAFPETRWDDKTRQEVQWCGMSLRAYFAGQAMAAIVGWSDSPSRKDGETYEQAIARISCNYADALIAALNE